MQGHWGSGSTIPLYCTVQLSYWWDFKNLPMSDPLYFIAHKTNNCPFVEASYSVPVAGKAKCIVNYVSRTLSEHLTIHNQKTEDTWEPWEQ